VRRTSRDGLTHGTKQLMARKPHQRPSYKPPFQRERERENFILTRWKEQEQFRRTHRAAAKLFEKFKREAEQEGERVPGWAGKVS
jgi:hypothetical protein